MGQTLPTLKKGQTADICFLLEGTYPYVRGGVSSWVHQLINGLPDYTFALVFMGATREEHGTIRYELPDNVVHLENHFIMESWSETEPKPRNGKSRLFKQIEKSHRSYKKGKMLSNKSLDGLAEMLISNDLEAEDFLYNEKSWEMIRKSYYRFCTDPSFVDYFWTLRTMHAPIFTLARIARHAPPARVYHSASTGYAGFLGMMIQRQTNKPFILSEHGIYTKERKIDLAQVEWITEHGSVFKSGMDDRVSYLRRLWINFFENLGRMTYASADPIIALYADNQKRQFVDGAPKNKCIIIPNGIRLTRFNKLRAQRPEHVPPVLGLIGRVVPIKDIKTFIRGMRALCTHIPDAEGWIIGPEEEAPEYVAECKRLNSSLGLENNVKFLGFQRIDDILPKMGLMVLTSISEGQPLVILEGYAAGLPVIATDVGGCRELVEGRTEEDKALGVAGAIAPIADASAFAHAALSLLQDEVRWKAAQEAGIQRVEKFYSEELLLKNYGNLYEEAFASWQA